MITTAYKFEANIKDVIKLKEEFRKVKLQLDGLTKSTKAYKEASANLKSIGTDLNNAKNAANGTNKATQQLNKSGLNLVNTFKSAAVAIMAAFAFRAIIGGLKSVVTSFKEFEAQMAAVKAISGATADEFERLEESARQYGRTTVFTAVQVAQLQEEFARLGFSTDEILAATGATLNLAAATGESLANSAQVAGSTLRAFGMDASLTVEVADTMAASFTNSALNLDAFTESMKFVAPVARTTGFTLQETTAILANLADNGIRGSIAGNSLKNILLRLADSNSDLSKRLGGTVQGTGQLADALEKLKEEGFDATDAVELLDKRAAPAFLALINNIDGLRDSTQILNDAEGAVTEMAAIRLDTLQGDMTLLQSASEGVALALGEEFKVTLRNVVFSLTEFLQKVADSPTAIYLLKTALQLAAVAVTTLMARFAAQGIISFIGGIRSAATSILTMLTPSIRGATVAQQGLNTAVRMNPFVAVASVVAGLASAYFLMGEEMSEAEMKQRRLNEAMKEELSLTFELSEGTSARAEKIRQLKDSLGSLGDEIDIEIATNEELREIEEFITSTEHLTVRIAQLTSEMEEAQEILDNPANLDYIPSQIRKQIQEATEAGKDVTKWQKMLEEVNERGFLTANQLKTLTDSLTGQSNVGLRGVIKNFNKQIINNKRIVRDNKKAIDEQNKLYKKSLKNQDFYINLFLGADASFRAANRKRLEGELEDFRNFSRSKQKLKIEELETQMKELQFLETFGDLQTQLSETDRDANPTIFTRIQNDMRELQREAGDFNIAQEFTKAFQAGTLGENSVLLSLLESFVGRFKTQLKTASTAVTEFGEVTAVKLRKTKDILKDLIKGLGDGIEDSITSEMVDVKINYQFEVDEIDKEKELIQANIDDIEFMRDEGSQAELSKMIETNRKKFHVLESLSNEEFQYLVKTPKELSKMSEVDRATHAEEMLRITQLMIDEETNKMNNHNQRRTQLTMQYHEQMAELRRENVNEMMNEINEEAILTLNNQNKNEFSLFKNFAANRRLRENAVRIATQNITDIEGEALIKNQELYDKGLISWTDFQNNKTRIEANAEGERLKLRQDADADDVKALHESLDRIQEYYSMASEALFSFMNNRIEIRRQEINEEFDQDQQMLNDEMEAQLEANEGNAQAQEAIRKNFNERQIVLEKRKDEELRKLAKKEFHMQKANDIVSAIINGAVAITKVAGQTGIGAIAAAPLMSALVAAQIAAIAAQKFVGAKGGVIPDIPEFGGGGMVYGPSHAQGGVKFNAGGRVVELEGGEAVINKRSTSMFRNQLSAMNAAGGGVRFAEGGITPGTSNMLQNVSSTNKVALSADDITQIVGGINDKTVTVTEGDVTSAQENVSISELTSSIF
jgi:TP901 family phage tail tape measure protein